MKTVKILLGSLVFLAGAAAAVWIFMPWKQVGEGALLFVSRRLPPSSPLSYSTVKSVPGGFSVENLGVSRLAGMADVSCRTLTVVPDLVGSLLNLAPTCRVTFLGASLEEIAVTPLKKLPGIGLGDGRVTVVAGGREIFLDGLRTGGELAMNGILLFNPSTMRIVRSDVALNVRSEPFENEVLPFLKNMLPLRREAPGNWRLFREAAL
ncbi:MAG: hypothetical protein LBR71_06420 [Synergistaceae bacterium]|jgi:hypothetical protein|nr:hypothetical protein [Synergistaceae bacterium]